MEKNNKEEQNITWASVKKFVTGCFSFQGFYNNQQFIQAMILGACIKDLSVLADNLYIKMGLVFCGLYIYLASFQKRCRDLNMKGTLILLIVSVYFIFLSDTFDLKKVDFSSINMSDIVSIGGTLLYYGVFLFALLADGAKDKNLNLTGLLLKYPKVYFFVCCIIYWYSSLW